MQDLFGGKGVTDSVTTIPSDIGVSSVGFQLELNLRRKGSKAMPTPHLLCESH